MKKILNPLIVLFCVTNVYAQQGSPENLNYFKLGVSPSAALASEASSGTFPVTISSPDQPINTPVNPGATQTVHFTLHNNISSQSVPMLGISGLSGFISQTNNCGSSLGANQSCTISMTIAPTIADAGTTVSANLNVNYGGRYPACYPSSQCNGSFSVVVNSNIATLTISDSPAPLLMVNGYAKQITINNTSAYDAENFSVGLSGLSGVTVSPGSCGSTLAANSSCTVSLTPPATGGVTGDGPAASGTLSATASNATASSSSSETVYLLNYGNAYNDGYIYALTDSSDPTVSLTGAVAETSDLSSATVWSKSSTALAGTSFYDGGYDSTTPGNMYLMLQAGITNFAAGEACYNYIASDNVPNVWYLPAICELGGVDQGAGCTNATNNMLTELVNHGIGGFASGISDKYWSSTQFSLALQAWYQSFASGGSQNHDSKNINHIVRCARAISYPNT